jgi:hypothetical protein
MFSIVLHLPLSFQTSKMDTLLEIDCSVHAADLARLRSTLAIDATPGVQLDVVRKVFGDPVLRTRIVGFLNHGDAKDLVTSLQVSKPFFHTAATTLCRRIEVPLYEYSSTEARCEYPVDMYCVSCHNEQPMPYRQEYGITAHRSLHSGLGRVYLGKIQHTYRDRFPATATMKEMYKYVRVVSVEQHDSCDRFALSHPLPFVQTEYVETLVLRLQHETPYTSCPTQDLPRHFNPKRLVLLFKQEPSRKEYGRRDSGSDRCHMVAYGPVEGKDDSSNTFYRMAKMALAVGNDCKVCIVAADHAALHLRGMERHDRSLAGFHPLYPHAQKKREEIPLYRRITLPTGAQWEIDDEEPEISRWRSEDGELHHIDEAMDYYDSCDSEDIEEREREASGIPAKRPVRML